MERAAIHEVERDNLEYHQPEYSRKNSKQNWSYIYDKVTNHSSLKYAAPWVLIRLVDTVIALGLSMCAFKASFLKICHINYYYHRSVFVKTLSFFYFISYSTVISSLLLPNKIWNAIIWNFSTSFFFHTTSFEKENLCVIILLEY